MATVNPGIRKYMLLGKLLEIRHPDIAEKLLKENRKSKPSETDMARIDAFYSSFCHDNNIINNECKGRKNAEHRRIFIGAILRLYSPGTYVQPREFMIVKSGVVSRLSDVLQINPAYTSRLTRQVILMERVYNDFRREVQNTKKRLTKSIN